MQHAPKFTSLRTAQALKHRAGTRPIAHADDAHHRSTAPTIARHKVQAVTRFSRFFHANASERSQPAVAPRTALPFVQQLRLYLSTDALKAGRPYCVAILLDNAEVCWLDAKQDRLQVQDPSTAFFEVLRTLLPRSGPRLALKPITHDAFDLHAADSRALPLRPTLWELGLDMGTSALPLPPLQHDTRLQLRRWPDFRVLAHRHDDFRLCALMIKQGVDVDTCCRVLDLPAARVQSFFNAAFFSGYAHPATDNARPLRAASHGGLAGLWRQVRVRWST